MGTNPTDDKSLSELSLVELVSLLLEGTGLEPLPPDTTPENLEERLQIIMQAAADEMASAAEQVDAGAERVAMNLGRVNRSRDPGRRTDAQVKADFLRRGTPLKFFPKIAGR